MPRDEERSRTIVLPAVNDLPPLDDIFQGLDEDEMDFVVARAQTRSIRNALDMCGIKQGSWYVKPRSRRDYLGELALMLRARTSLLIQKVFENAAVESAKAIIDLVKNEEDARIVLAAAKEVLDRSVGRVPYHVRQDVRKLQKVELSWSNGNPIARVD